MALTSFSFLIRFGGDGENNQGQLVSVTAKAGAAFSVGRRSAAPQTPLPMLYQAV